LFSVIAIFILAIACINYMNLATARASRHSKEVGVKKTLGISRSLIATQYLGESMLMVILSLLLAIGMVVVLLPQFNVVTGKHLTLTFTRELLLGIAGITLFTGLISGSYPALYLSKFNPVVLLRKAMNTSVSELWARQGLVIFQFTLSIMLIVSVTIVYKQIDFVQSKNLGYDKDHIIYFKQEGNVTGAREPFLDQLKKVDGVVNAAVSGTNLIGTNNSTFGIEWEGKAPEDQSVFEVVSGGYDLIETFAIEMKEGRSFSKNFGTDPEKLIFNETAIQTMGLKDAIGKTVRMWGEDKQIIGVTKDFHFQSLHEKVKPLVFMLDQGRTLEVMVRIAAGKEKETIARLESFYKDFNPGISFDYHFMSRDYEAQYASEQRVSVLSRYFAGLAILISCLGLFGLASFSAERRQKEIGIRKVLGLSESGIIFLLSSDFTKMVITAIAVALPASYFLSQNWLNSFAFHIELKWWYFVGAGIIALSVAWITIGIQILKAARVSPVNSLKTE
jgi:ABC-type antimicrobial peptide transport system permease subunit